MSDLPHLDAGLDGLDRIRRTGTEGSVLRAVEVVLGSLWMLCGTGLMHMIGMIGLGDEVQLLH